MDLVLIQPYLMRHVRLLRQQILNLPNAIHVQQTILRPQRQAQWLRHGIKIAGYSHQTGMARKRRVHPADTRAVRILGLPVRLQDGVAAAPKSTTSAPQRRRSGAAKVPLPAEPNRPDLVRARDHTHGIDEGVDLRAADALAVADQPRAQRGRHDGRILRLVHQRELLLVLQRGLDVLQEGQRERVPVVHVRDVAVEAAGFGILVGEQAYVLRSILARAGGRFSQLALLQKGGTYGQLPAEDVDEEDDGLGLRAGRGLRDVGLDATDGFDAPGRGAGVDLARHAAGGNADAGRHCGTVLSIERFR